MANSLPIMLKGAAFSGVFVASFGAFAQAPVYDVNGVATNPTARPANSLEQRVVLLERMVESRTEMQHRLQQQLDTMQGEVDELRGAVEVHTNQLEKVLERQRELYLEIDKRVEAMNQSGGGAGSATPANKPADAPLSNNLDETTAYDKAVDLILKSREYDKAIPAFQAFIQRFPDSQYAPNAHYWLGQLLFNQQEWDQAAEQFSLVANRFSDSTKRPDALLKLGVIAERQGNKSKARDLLQQVINQYPNSSAKKLAESRLGGL